MFNQKVTGEKLVRNPEGYDLYKDNPDLSLFLSCLDFKPRNSFYLTADDKFQNINKAIKLDDFGVALAWHIGSKMGMRLSPTVILNRMATLLRDTKDPKEAKIMRDKIRFVMHKVFTRPDFLANSFGYYQHTEGSIKKMPSWVRKELKAILETFPEITLKKGKLKRKQMKLADMIKILHPKPKKKLGELYKSIIENTKESKIKEKESIKVALSSTNLTKEEKKEVITKSLDKVGINEVVRNISNLQDTDMKIVDKRLTEIVNTKDCLRVLNPFDLIMDSSFVEPVKTVTIDKALITLFKNNYDFKIEGRTAILFDLSGSMEGEGVQKGSKFISLIRQILTDDIVFYGFGTSLIPSKEMTELVIATKSPNFMYANFMKRLHANGGTYLLCCLRDLIEREPDLENIIIVTDEMTWNEDYSIKEMNKLLPDNLKNKVILYNTDYSGLSAFKREFGILKLSGIEGKILLAIKMFYNFNSFKQDMIDDFLKEFESSVLQ